VAIELPMRIETERLVVREVEERDLVQLLSINADEAVTRHLPYERWKSLDDGTAWLERMRKLEASGTGVQLVVAEKSSLHAVGTCLLFRLEETSLRAELGYVLGRAHWGKGLMHEALSSLIAHAFESQGLRRLEAEVNPTNARSCRLLERLGFKNEGRLRKRWIAKGAVYDTLFYGLLREEWPPAQP
jgi:[ribosomal protein S5]-alanine N-acetyltransferase